VHSASVSLFRGRIHAFCDAQVRVVRIFNTYGPNMALDDGRVVSNFVAQALTEQPLTIFGDGQQTRSFQYVSDLIEGEHLPARCTRVLCSRRRVHVLRTTQMQQFCRVAMHM
jgi:dTDP-D-glucose 4,6-dehydratase